MLVNGAPVTPDSVFSVLRRYCRWKKIEYPGDSFSTLIQAVELLNILCRVDFLQAYRPGVSISPKYYWMITFYTNRNIGRNGLVDEKKEDELVDHIHKLLHLPVCPPKLWCWADVEEGVK